MIRLFRQHYPLILLLISGLIFSFNFANRYDLPIHDESLYANGNFTIANGWAQLYQLMYFILNPVTASPVLSFDIILFSFSFIFLPLAVYSFARAMDITKPVSSVIAFLCLLSPWNFPSDPKVQVFNFTLIALAAILRLRVPNPLKGRLLSYFVLILSVYSRQDNLIILIFLSLYDSIYFIRTKQPVLILKLFLGGALFSLALYLFFHGSPFDPNRSWKAFLDYFRWRNASELAPLLSGQGTIFEQLHSFLNGADSIIEAFIAQPRLVTLHFYKNFVELLPVLINNFAPLLNFPQWIFWPLIVLVTLASNQHPEKKPLRAEHLIWIGAFCLKAFAIALLLQPMGKYVFEFNIAFLFMAGFWLSRYRLIGRGTRLSLSLFFLPLLLFSHPFDQKQLQYEFSMRATQVFLRSQDQVSPIKKIISIDGFYNWLKTPHPVDIWNNRGEDLLIKKNLKEFLVKHKVDTIIMEPHLRWQIQQVDLTGPFLKFEQSPEEYGFKILLNRPDEKLTIYRTVDEY